MTHDEALAEADRLRRERPGRLFAPRETADGDWTVVAASVAGAPGASGPWHAETRVGPETTPDPAEDPLPPVHGRRGF